MIDEATWQAQKQYVTVDGQRMAYIEMGSGRPIVFEHGNPTSSFLWRNIHPTVARCGRCIAIDLVGMGDSDKLEDTGARGYDFFEHREYWTGALEALNVDRDVVFVLHDWGSALGFDWACANPHAVAGICYTEALVDELSCSDCPAAAVDLFQALRSSAGEKLVLDENVFIEQVLPGAILRTLSATEMAAYRAPFLSPGEDRRPTLSWPRELPIEGEPAAICAVVRRYRDWMVRNDLPKLFINADPGMILTGRLREFARGWCNQAEVSVPGLHFLQEDSPAAIASALCDWLDALG